MPGACDDGENHLVRRVHLFRDGKGCQTLGVGLDRFAVGQHTLEVRLDLHPAEELYHHPDSRLPGLKIGDPGQGLVLRDFQRDVICRDEHDMLHMMAVVRDLRRFHFQPVNARGQLSTLQSGRGCRLLGWNWRQGWSDCRNGRCCVCRIGQRNHVRLFEVAFGNPTVKLAVLALHLPPYVMIGTHRTIQHCEVSAIRSLSDNRAVLRSRDVAHIDRCGNSGRYLFVGWDFLAHHLHRLPDGENRRGRLDADDVALLSDARTVGRDR